MNNTDQKLQTIDDRIQATVQGIQVAHDWWLCRRGCDGCCRRLARPPELTQLEWARVDQAVAMLTPTVRAEVEHKIDALLVQIAENTVGQYVVCPYLDENSGACLIYDSRPIACRTYGFFVTRTSDLYCKLIETEVNARGDHIVWGNAEVIDDQLTRLAGEPISFKVHYIED
jgi:Fe-S-cluster containining protein